MKLFLMKFIDSDPVDYSSLEEEKHPFSWFLPGDGVQRGTIVWRDGDPSTPLYPALGNPLPPNTD